MAHPSYSTNIQRLSMKFVSREIWEFLQAIAQGNISIIQELTEKKLNLNQYFYILDIDNLDEEERLEYSYEVDLSLIEPEVITFFGNLSSTTYSYTPLSVACWTGNLDLVKLLIEAGADVNYDQASPYMFFPIQLANKNIAEYLLSKGADINATSVCGNSPVEDAISSGDKELALFLLDNGADPTIESNDGWHEGWDSIQQAIWQKNETVLDKISEKGFDLSDYLQDFAEHGLISYIHTILKDWQIRVDKDWQAKIDRAFHSSTKAGNDEIAALLLASGANPNSENISNIEESEYELEW